MEVVGVILARGGSKGIPRKNLKKCGGMSLVRRCVNTALLSRLDLVVISSDDEEILNHVLAEYEDVDRITFAKRPDAPDDQSSEEAMDQTIRALARRGGGPIDHAMLLQCTAPGLLPSDIDRALRAYNGRQSVVTVREFGGHVGELYTTEDQDQDLWRPTSPVTVGDSPAPHTRQLNRPRYVEAGSLYLAPATAWSAGNRYTEEGIVPVIVPRWRSVEIDDPLDLATWRRCFDLWRTPWSESRS